MQAGRVLARPAPIAPLARAEVKVTLERFLDRMMAAANDRLFARLCTLLGHPEWATTPDYADATRRVRNRAALAALIE